jgi:uncharacterized damage-inducible protein DinB
MISDKNPLMASQIKLWRERIKPSIIKSFDNSPDDKLNWAPAAEMITLGGLFTHISECSEWWLDQVIYGGKSQLMAKDKDKEAANVPARPARPRVEIAGFLDIHWARLERFFACEPSILKKNYSVAGREKNHIFDGYWIFTHLLEHDIHHRSQINQYLRILGIIPPRI